MKTGIVGYGKMGRDIFSLLFGKLAEANIAVYCRHDTDTFTALTVKELDKSLRRKKITQKEYEIKKNSFIFTDNLTDLSDCNIIIETISENLEEKRHILAELDKITDKTCLITSNTSTLNLSLLFNGISNPERCMGLHFFYPVKLSEYAEINLLSETSENSIKKAKQLMAECGKKVIPFSGKYNMYLNQILNAAVCTAIYIKENNQISVEETDKLLSDCFSFGGIFGILDNIGLKLIANSSDCFSIERISSISSYGKSVMNNWIASGCPTEPNCFLDFMKENDKSSFSAADKDYVNATMIASILNEMINAAEECDCNFADLTNAVQDIIGLSDTPSNYIKKYGLANLRAALSDLYEKSGFEFFMPSPENLWCKYYTAGR